MGTGISIWSWAILRAGFTSLRAKGRAGSLPEPKQITTDSGPLKIQGVHSDPFPVDWDGDGDLDLLSGSSNGGVQWAENQAGVGQPPALSQFRELIPPAPPVKFGQPLGEKELNGPTSSTRVWVDDVNSDGKLDVLLGDRLTLVTPAEDSARKSSRSNGSSGKRRWKRSRPSTKRPPTTRTN